MEDSTITIDLSSEDDGNKMMGPPFDPELDHPSLSPVTPAESFFIAPDLKTSTVSAYALAAQIKRERSARSIASAATDEFGSAIDINSSFGPNTPLPATPDFENLFGKDVLIHSREPVIDEHLDFHDADDMMASNDTETNETPNPALTVYESAKNVWAWGKGVPLVGFFEGVTEAVANKVVSVAGTSLEDIDGNIKPAISGIDKDFLNPAISAVVKVIMAGISKGDDIVRPVVMTVVPPILGPLGLMPEEKKEEAPAPEVTTPVTSVSAK